MAQWSSGRASDFWSKDRVAKPPVTECRTFQSKGPGFKTTCCRFKTWAISFTPLCPCLLEETLEAIGPFYLVSMPGEVKDPTRGKCVTCRGLKEWWSLSLTHQFPAHEVRHQAGLTAVLRSPVLDRRRRSAKCSQIHLLPVSTSCDFTLETSLFLIIKKILTLCFQ